MYIIILESKGDFNISKQVKIFILNKYKKKIPIISIILSLILLGITVNYIGFGCSLFIFFFSNICSDLIINKIIDKQIIKNKENNIIITNVDKSSSKINNQVMQKSVCNNNYNIKKSRVLKRKYKN